MHLSGAVLPIAMAGVGAVDPVDEAAGDRVDGVKGRPRVGAGQKRPSHE